MMQVVERTRSLAVVRSRRKLTFEEAWKRAERKRTDGKLVFEAVEDVNITCRCARVGGLWTSSGRVFE